MQNYETYWSPNGIHCHCLECPKNNVCVCVWFSVPSLPLVIIWLLSLNLNDIMIWTCWSGSRRLGRVLRACRPRGRCPSPRARLSLKHCHWHWSWSWRSAEQNLQFQTHCLSVVPLPSSVSIVNVLVLLNRGHGWNNSEFRACLKMIPLLTSLWSTKI